MLKKESSCFANENALFFVCCSDMKQTQLSLSPLYIFHMVIHSLLALPLHPQE